MFDVGGLNIQINAKIDNFRKNLKVVENELNKVSNIAAKLSTIKMDSLIKGFDYTSKGAKGLTTSMDQLLKKIAALRAPTDAFSRGMIKAMNDGSKAITKQIERLNKLREIQSRLGTIVGTGKAKDYREGVRALYGGHEDIGQITGQGYFDSKGAREYNNLLKQINAQTISNQEAVKQFRNIVSNQLKRTNRQLDKEQANLLETRNSYEKLAREKEKQTRVEQLNAQLQQRFAAQKHQLDNQAIRMAQRKAELEKKLATHFGSRRLRFQEKAAAATKKHRNATAKLLVQYRNLTRESNLLGASQGNLTSRIKLLSNIIRIGATKNVRKYREELERLQIQSKQLAASTSRAQAGTSFGSQAWFKQRAAWFIQLRGYWELYRGATAALTAVLSLEEELVNLQAITEATSEEMEGLEHSIRLAAISTKFYAADVAKVATVLGQAGFSAEEVSGIIQNVAVAASAVKREMEDTGDVMTSVLKAWRLDASESAAVANTLAAGISSARVQIEDFKTAMQYMSTIATQMNMSLEDTVAWVAVLREVGISASQAATSFRRIQGQLSKDVPSARVLRMLDRYDLKWEDISLRYNDLNDSLKKMKKNEISLVEILGASRVRTGSAYTAMIEFVDKQEELSSKMSSTNKAFEMNAKQLQAINNQFKQLWSKITDIAISVTDVGKGFNVFVDIIKGVTLSIGAVVLTVKQAVDTLFSIIADAIIATGLYNIVLVNDFLADLSEAFLDWNFSKILDAFSNFWLSLKANFLTGIDKVKKVAEKGWQDVKNIFAGPPKGGAKEGKIYPNREGGLPKRRNRLDFISEEAKQSKADFDRKLKYIKEEMGLKEKLAFLEDKKRNLLLDQEDHYQAALSLNNQIKEEGNKQKKDITFINKLIAKMNREYEKTYEIAEKVGNVEKEIVATRKKALLKPLTKDAPDLLSVSSIFKVDRKLQSIRNEITKINTQIVKARKGELGSVGERDIERRVIQDDISNLKALIKIKQEEIAARRINGEDVQKEETELELLNKQLKLQTVNLANIRREYAKFPIDKWIESYKKFNSILAASRQRSINIKRNAVNLVYERRKLAIESATRAQEFGGGETSVNSLRSELDSLRNLQNKLSSEKELLTEELSMAATNLFKSMNKEEATEYANAVTEVVKQLNELGLKAEEAADKIAQIEEELAKTPWDKFVDGVKRANAEFTDLKKHFEEWGESLTNLSQEGLTNIIGSFMFADEEEMNSTRDAIGNLQDELADLRGKAGVVKAELRELGSASNLTPEESSAYAGKKEELRDLNRQIREVNDSLEDQKNKFNDLQDPIDRAIEAFKDFADSVVKELQKIIAKLIAVWIWEQVTGMVMGGKVSGLNYNQQMGTSSNPTGSMAHMEWKGARGGVFPNMKGFRKLALGGVTNGPTMALLGDNKFGAGKEIVIPTDKIRSDSTEGYSRDSEGSGDMTIVNIVSPDLMQAAMQSAPGKNIILNTINSDVIRRGDSYRTIKGIK